ncbi:MAG: hypothetical protein II604_04835 [Bacteroidales bacterium]|nr:hypothetical protein [Bacteroidales bacterium]
MKVFGAKTRSGWSGGVILVAADTKEEAFGILCSDKEMSWMREYYPFENWREIEGLSWDGDKQIIIEDSYVE